MPNTPLSDTNTSSTVENRTLPEIMVAPNGARRTKADHPALPVTVEETVNAAIACHAAGAGGLHAHVRDRDGRHVLDAGLYRELLGEMAVKVPGMQAQITTEAVGIYSPEEQRTLVQDVMPKSVSVSLTEMLSDGDEAAARQFYHFAKEAGIAVQHILYSAEELARFDDLQRKGVLPDGASQLLFVLGRYTENQQSSPEQLAPFLVQLKRLRSDADWAVCAFGRGETDCLLAAHRAGGKMRIGFENSLWHRNGTTARDNADRVRELVSNLKQLPA